MISEVTKKTCTKCKTAKPLTEFHKRKDAKDGLQFACKRCHIARVRKWQKDHPDRVKEYAKTYTAGKVRLLQDWVAETKRTLGCSNCSEDCPDCLDLHHVNYDKDKSVAHLIVGKNVQRVVDEINKCCVLCSNCHRKHHAGHQIALGQTLSVTKEDFDDYCRHNQTET